MNPGLFAVGLVAAFVVGYLTGRISASIAQDKDPAREVAVDVRDVSTRLDKFNRGPWIITAAALILIAIGVQAGISAQQHNRDAARIEALASCVAQYENLLSVALPPVRNAAAEDDAADLAWKRTVAALFTPGHDKRDFAASKAALGVNIRTAEHLRRVRAANPYPTPPKKVCPIE